MKNLATTILILILVVIMGLYFVSFQVRETETVLVTTFKKPSRSLTEPGWYFKWPIPIQQVHRFDSRMQVLEGDVRETTTRGAIPIIVNTYIVWRIAEPLEFFNAVRTVKDAEDKLLSRIGDTQNRIVGQHTFGEFVNSDPSQVKIADIEGDMLKTLREPLLADYGIEIVTLGIKQLNVNEDVTQKVFGRMKADRERRTTETLAQGKADASKVEKDADTKRRTLEAAAEARATAIRGEGDAEAASYYELLKEDPEFAMFLRETEALEKILEKRSTVILSGDSEPIRLLKGMPSIKPKKD